MAHCPRFYLPSAFSGDHILQLKGPQAHHLCHVMRAVPGMVVRVFNGVSGEWEACVERVGKDRVDVRPLKCLRPPVDGQGTAPLAVPFILLMAALKPVCLETVVEKATELGVGEIRVCATDHTHVRPFSWRRLETIACEATQQSGRLEPPLLVQAAPLADHVAALGPVTLIWGDVPQGPGKQAGGDLQACLKISLDVDRAIACVIGPEGGWSEAERAFLSTHPHGYRLALGTTILRSETAALVSLGVIRWELDKIIITP